ncbi:hypothetical protein [Dactylosporangium darangshiense]|uniref:hypothetical protein n=1 Tax=Dactylosporangium darangshiense TaxID=579108 RepID=UPI0036393A72
MRYTLVQRATREAVPKQRRLTLATAAADALALVYRDVRWLAANQRSFQANATALHTTAGLRLWDTRRGPHRVLLYLGAILGTNGFPQDAVAFFTQLHAETRRHLADDHPAVLLIRYGIAQWRAATGDYAETDGLLADFERVLGAKHPGTTALRGRRAERRGLAGEPGLAAAELLRLYQESVKYSGPAHAATLDVGRRLTRWQVEAGDARGALETAEELVRACRETHDADHPLAFGMRTDLAHVRIQTGDLVSALADLEELYAEAQRLWGAADPMTLNARGNLARCRLDMGDAAGAAVEFGELRAEFERLHGPHHQLTLTTRWNLAQASSLSGDAAAWDRLVEDCRRLYRPDHPALLAARAARLQAQGEATDTLEALLADHERALGPDHPATLAVHRMARAAEAG